MSKIHEFFEKNIYIYHGPHNSHSSAVISPRARLCMCLAFTLCNLMKRKRWKNKHFVTEFVTHSEHSLIKTPCTSNLKLQETWIYTEKWQRKTRQRWGLGTDPWHDLCHGTQDSTALTEEEWRGGWTWTWTESDKGLLSPQLRSYERVNAASLHTVLKRTAAIWLHLFSFL